MNQQDQKRFISASLLVVIAMGFVFGRAVGGTIWMGLLGLGWSLAVVFVGTTLGMMHSLTSIRAKEQELAKERQELDNHRIIIDLEKENLARQRRNLGRDSAGLIRAITNRVANRILSKYVPDLSPDVRRNKIFRDVDEIVMEELGRENVEAPLTRP